MDQSIRKETQRKRRSQTVAKKYFDNLYSVHTSKYKDKKVNSSEEEKEWRMRSRGEMERKKTVRREMSQEKVGEEKKRKKRERKRKIVCVFEREIVVSRD